MLLKRDKEMVMSKEVVEEVVTDRCLVVVVVFSGFCDVWEEKEK